MAPSPRPQDPQLAGWYDDIDTIRNDARAALANLQPNQLAWRPAPGKWSILEVLDHLIVTAREAGRYQRAAIDEARTAGRTGQGPFRFGPLGGWFVRATGPNPKRPMPGPAVFAPGADLDPARTIASFETTQDQLQALFVAADGLDLGRIRARSAATALMRFNLATWFASTVGHERRHLQQIAGIRAHAQFPKS